MKKIIFLITGIITVLGLSAQNTQLKGKVTDAETKAPLSNASIRIAGNKGTTSDKAGNFALACTADSVTVMVSYIGYESFSKKVGCNQSIDIMLSPSTGNLNNVEITATSGANKAMLYQPASIARIGETEIKRGMGILMDDAINANIPGVTMQRRTFSAGQQFNIRGYGNGTRGTNGVNSNFDGQGYKVYLNGIPVTDAEGITLMDDIDFGSVGNVEVVKGPSGTIYGQAIAGVVNLETKKAAPGKTTFGQDVLLGSYGLQRYTTHLEIGKEHASFMVNYGKQLYDGFMPHTNSEKDFVNMYGTFTPNDKQTITTYVGYSNSYDQRNGEITIAQWAKEDYSGNPAYIKNDAHSNVITFRAGVGHTYQLHKNISNTTSFFGTSLSSNVSSAGGWTDKTSTNYGLRSTFDMHFTLSNGSVLSGITGVELQKQNAQILGYPMIADSFHLTGYNIIGNLRSNQYTISKTSSAFTEWTLAFQKDFSITGGIGWSGLGIELNDRFYAASNNNPSNPNGTRKPAQYKNKFNDMVSPHIALNKVIAKDFSVYGSFSSGYKAPVSSYFFVPLTGDVLTGLKPESAAQFEIGSKGNLLNKRLNFQFAIFSTKYKDKMTTIAVPNASNTATSYVYVANGGDQNNLGVELAIRGAAYQSDKFIKNISPFANIAYSHFRYGDFKYQQLSPDKKSTVTFDYSDNGVAGVPPVTFNTGFDLATRPGLYLNMTYSYRDKMYFTSDNVNQAAPTTLLNSKIGYGHMLGTHVSIDIYAAVNNITGHQNYAMVFLNQLPDAYIPAPNEANYFGGVNLKFIF